MNKSSATYAVNQQPKTGSAHEVARLIGMARLGGYVGEKARTRLVHNYYRWIRQSCFHALGNEADAEDAAQEVALRLYRAVAQFEGRSSLRTWLSTIIRNECINLIRKRQRALLTDHMQALIALHEGDRRNPRASADVPLAAVRVTLDRLPAQAREVLLLRFFSELGLDDIAAVLGISLSATKMRLYRALDQFKRLYCQIDGGDALPA